MPDISCVHQEFHVEECLTAILYENDIVEIKWDESIDMIDVYHLMEMQNVVRQIGAGKKMPILFVSHAMLRLSDDAAKFAVSDEGVEFSLALAMLINDPILQFNYNYFLKNNQPIVPTQAFRTKEEAISWLSGFVE